MSSPSFMYTSIGITKDLLILTFSGRQQGLASLTIFEFRKFLEENYPNIDKCYCRDEKLSWYTHGITDISTNVIGTLIFLKKIIKQYKKVVFIGASMGGYAALLYGSLLNVDTIIAFRPQTYLDYVKLEYNVSLNIDINDVLNDTTNYFIYGDSAILDETDIHSISHCRRLLNKDNINIIEINNFDIKEYKDRGSLKKDFDIMI